MSAVEGNAYHYVRCAAHYAERLLRLPLADLKPEARAQVDRDAWQAMDRLRDVREAIDRADILQSMAEHDQPDA